MSEQYDKVEHGRFERVTKTLKGTYCQFTPVLYGRQLQENRNNTMNKKEVYIFNNICISQNLQ